jgi:hypothetical protein
MSAGRSSQYDGLILLDHDNIPFESVSLRQILETWFGRIPQGLLPAGTVSIKVRSYGGWYRQSQTSEGRFKASEFYQDECPSMMKARNRYWRLHFEFADKLLMPAGAEPIQVPPSITHTVAVRASAENVVARIGAAPCPETDCQLRSVKKWIKLRRACTRTACPYEFKDQFERLQQRQVDTHLATDLMTWAYTWDRACRLAVASDDIDLLPALGAAALVRQNSQSLTQVRFFTQSTYLDATLASLGVSLVNASLT